MPGDVYLSECDEYFSLIFSKWNEVPHTHSHCLCVCVICFCIRQSEAKKKCLFTIYREKK